MKILLLAGEESGQLYARKLAEIWRGHEIRGYGDYGFEISDLAVMGFAAVLRRIGYFMRVKRTIERAIDEWRPDLVCTIDYPGLNLALAAYARRRGIRAVHVVCPQVWAWKSGRIPKIEAAVDTLCCFFPFEPALFKPGFAEFVGHPLAVEFAGPSAKARDAQLVALLPGSRSGEIARCLPVLLRALRQLPATVRAVIPAANERAHLQIVRICARTEFRALAGRIDVRRHGAREALMTARCAAVASGTATLEAALARCPTVLVYRVDPFLAWFARRVIKGVRHVGLVNVLWEKSGERGSQPMVELLQQEFTPERLAAELRRFLDRPDAVANAVSALDAVVAQLDCGGDPLRRVAEIAAGVPAADRKGCE